MWTTKKTFKSRKAYKSTDTCRAERVWGMGGGLMSEARGINEATMMDQACIDHAVFPAREREYSLADVVDDSARWLYEKSVAAPFDYFQKRN